MTIKLLVANRGEIAVRIIRTAKKLEIHTVAIYTLPDASALHVSLADEAYPVGEESQNSRGYMEMQEILDIATHSGATLIAPGYGFLSENHEFASLCQEADITFLGPTPSQMMSMGLKHEARQLAIHAGIPIVPGTAGTIDTLDDALEAAERIQYPIMLKATGGGGGMGMQLCEDAGALKTHFRATQEKSGNLFKNTAVFLERYIPFARHIEVQVFGDGEGNVIHFGERECSVQRRHQKVIEEGPSPFLDTCSESLRASLHSAAVKLCSSISYCSAGTVEFIVDDSTGEFFFLELNARIQVEHAVTEMIHPGLDIVELMIQLGTNQRSKIPFVLPKPSTFALAGHAIEARLYCENPMNNLFTPAPGTLHEVRWPISQPWLRIDTWVKTGTVISTHYDPLIAKIIVHGSDRQEALTRLEYALEHTRIVGPPNNVEYLIYIVQDDKFKLGQITTTYLSTLNFVPRAIKVVEGGLLTTIQDLPGRKTLGNGVPLGGAADMLSAQIANILVNNPRETELVEGTMIGPSLEFLRASMIAITGAETPIRIDGILVPMWTRLSIKAGSLLEVGTAIRGLRMYIAVAGGLPGASTFMGSKSTMTMVGVGGHQGRALLKGDILQLSAASSLFGSSGIQIPQSFIPQYPDEWELEVLPAAQWDHEYITAEGMMTLTTAKWKVNPSSGRSGLRLEGPMIQWARTDGGEGGSHPSNVLDQDSIGALNMNGDTPVLFGVDAPDAGGFVNVLNIPSASLWKLGQIRPGDTVTFKGISYSDAPRLHQRNDLWLKAIGNYISSSLENSVPGILEWISSGPLPSTSLRLEIPSNSVRPCARIRQVGDAFFYVEVGPMALDLVHRARLEYFTRELDSRNVKGILSYLTCIRSSMIHFDERITDVEQLFNILVEVDYGLPDALHMPDLEVNIHRMPFVFDDRWCQEAVDRYIQSVRDKAVYLPSNVDYIAENNGMKSRNEVAESILSCPWIVFGTGFFVGLPFIVPMDPRKRILGQKYNPTRLYTPEGAVGLAGVVGAIYPLQSAGGYQLLGRTLSTWNTWDDEHFSMKSFDQIEWYRVSEEEYNKLSIAFKAGIFKPKVRKGKFQLATFLKEMTMHETGVRNFLQKQKEASNAVALKEEKMFLEWKTRQDVRAKTKIASPIERDVSGSPITSPLSANVWKVEVSAGYKVQQAEKTAIILEAMKTEIEIKFGEDDIGKTVSSIAILPGDTVIPGQPLLYLS